MFLNYGGGKKTNTPHGENVKNTIKTDHQLPQGLKLVIFLM